MVDYFSDWQIKKNLSILDDYDYNNFAIIIFQRLLNYWSIVGFTITS